jgi:hypothetical protein
MKVVCQFEKLHQFCLSGRCYKTIVIQACQVGVGVVNVPEPHYYNTAGAGGSHFCILHVVSFEMMVYCDFTRIDDLMAKFGNVMHFQVHLLPKDFIFSEYTTRAWFC